MKIISVFNGKGGTSKSTISTELFTGLALKGYRCLLLDLDEQADSSFMVGADSDFPNIYDVLMKHCPLSSALQVVRENAEVVGGSEDMAFLDLDLIGLEYPIERLHNVIEDYGKEWDYVIIDLPPHSGIALFNALNISDSLLIPIIPDMLSLKAVQSISRTLEKVRKTINPNLEIEGLVLSRFDNRPLISRTVKKNAENIAKSLGTNLLGTIRETAKVREAQAVGKSVQLYAPKNNASIDYKNLIEAFLKGSDPK